MRALGGVAGAFWLALIGGVAGYPVVGLAETVHSSSSGATIDFYVDLASASDKARLVLGSVEALVND